MDDKKLDGDSSVSEVVKDLPLYEQILDRGHLLGKMISRNLIETIRHLAASNAPTLPGSCYFNDRHLTVVETEFSIKWIQENPELFDLRFAELMAGKSEGWKISSKSTAGFITFTCERVGGDE